MSKRVIEIRVPEDINSTEVLLVMWGMTLRGRIKSVTPPEMSVTDVSEYRLREFGDAVITIGGIELFSPELAKQESRTMKEVVNEEWRKHLAQQGVMSAEEVKVKNNWIDLTEEQYNNGVKPDHEVKG